MLDFMGWYEVLCLAMVCGAYYHGTRTGMKQNMATGVELTLNTLEKQGVIRVCPDTGAIEGIAKSE